MGARWGLSAQRVIALRMVVPASVSGSGIFDSIGGLVSGKLECLWKGDLP
jgi:hypothetical protein